MRVLVTGSAGHLGEAMVRTLVQLKYEVIGLDIRESPSTSYSIIDRSFVSDVSKVLKRFFMLPPCINRIS